MSGLAFASCVQLPVEREIAHLRSPFRTATPSQVSYWPIILASTPERMLSAASLVEIGIVMQARRGDDGGRDLDLLLTASADPKIRSRLATSSFRVSSKHPTRSQHSKSPKSPSGGRSSRQRVSKPLIDEPNRLLFTSLS
jgi:hypothetical protein